MDLTLGRKAVQVRNTIGRPGQANVYRVGFQVPDVVKPGLASLSMTVACIAAPVVKIPVQ